MDSFESTKSVPFNNEKPSIPIKSPLPQNMNKQKLFEFPMNPELSDVNKTLSSFRKTMNNNSPGKTFYSKQKPMEQTAMNFGITVFSNPQPAKEEHRKKEPEDPMMKSLYETLKSNSSTLHSTKPQQIKHVKSPSSRNVANSPKKNGSKENNKLPLPINVVSPAPLPQVLPAPNLSQNHSFASNRFKRKKSDDLAHLMESTQGGAGHSQSQSPFKNSALQKGKGVNIQSFQFQIASTQQLIAMQPSSPREIEKLLLQQLPLNHGLGLLQKDDSNQDFMSMEQYRKVVEETESLLMRSDDPNIANAAAEHRRSRKALQILNANQETADRKSLNPSRLRQLSAQSNDNSQIYKLEDSPKYQTDQPQALIIKAQLFQKQAKKSRQDQKTGLDNKQASKSSASKQEDNQTYNAKQVVVFPMEQALLMQTGSTMSHNFNFSDGPNLIGMPSMGFSNYNNYRQSGTSTIFNSNEIKEAETQVGQNPGFNFSAPMAPVKILHNDRKKDFKKQLIGMKKNLKLIKQDSQREKNNQKMNKIYEKLKITLEPIAENSIGGQSAAHMKTLHEQSSILNSTNLLDVTMDLKLKDLDLSHEQNMSSNQREKHAIRKSDFGAFSLNNQSKCNIYKHYDDQHQSKLLINSETLRDSSHEMYKQVLPSQRLLPPIIVSNSKYSHSFVNSGETTPQMNGKLNPIIRNFNKKKLINNIRQQADKLSKEAAGKTIDLLPLEALDMQLDIPPTKMRGQKESSLQKYPNQIIDGSSMMLSPKGSLAKKRFTSNLTTQAVKNNTSIIQPTVRRSFGHRHSLGVMKGGVATRNFKLKNSKLTPQDYYYQTGGNHGPIISPKKEYSVHLHNQMLQGGEPGNEVQFQQAFIDQQNSVSTLMMLQNESLDSKMKEQLRKYQQMYTVMQ